MEEYPSLYARTYFRGTCIRRNLAIGVLYERAILLRRRKHYKGPCRSAYTEVRVAVWERFSRTSVGVELTWL